MSARPSFVRAMRRLLERARYEILRRVGVGTTVIEGVEIPLASSLSHGMRETLLMRRYERREARVLKARLEPGDRVLELGAGIGFTATICARSVGSRSVMTVEANPEMIPLIKEVFARNGVSPTLLRGAVNATGHDMTLNVTSDYWSASTYDRPGVERQVLAPGLAFVDLVADFSPTAILIDLEGGELDLISETIAPGVQKLLIELHEHVIGAAAVPKVRKWVAQQGFAVLEDAGNRSIIYCER